MMVAAPQLGMKLHLADRTVPVSAVSQVCDGTGPSLHDRHPDNMQAKPTSILIPANHHIDSVELKTNLDFILIVEKEVS